jgi:hypothetical protein
MSLPVGTQLVIGLIVLLHVGPVIWALFSKHVTKIWLLIFVVLPIVGPLLYLAKRAFTGTGGSLRPS